MDIYTSIFKVIFVLIGMVAAMILLYRYAGKLKLNLNLKPKATEYPFRKIDSIHLGYKKFVSIVEVHDHILVIGVGDKDMSLLTSWKKEEPTT